MKKKCRPHALLRACSLIVSQGTSSSLDSLARSQSIWTDELLHREVWPEGELSHLWPQPSECHQLPEVLHCRSWSQQSAQCGRMYRRQSPCWSPDLQDQLIQETARSQHPKPAILWQENDASGYWTVQHTAWNVNDTGKFVLYRERGGGGLTEVIIYEHPDSRLILNPAPAPSL